MVNHIIKPLSRTPNSFSLTSQTSALQALPRRACLAEGGDLRWLRPAWRDRSYRVTESVGTSCGSPERLSPFYCILVANKIDVAPTCFPILFTRVGVASGGLRLSNAQTNCLKTKRGICILR